MRTTKWTGLLFAAFLVLSCDTKKIGKCTSQADCPEEGAYCDNETALCVLNCETRECDPGHFCDLSTKQCVTECPYVCPTPPENATITCEDPCVGFTCNSGFHVCSGDRCASDTDATACGPNCVQCTTTDPNAELTCESNACVSKCKTGFRPSGTGCVACPGSDCSTIQPVTTTTYNNTELTWQACAAGYIGNDCQTETGTAKTMDWEAAKKYCDDSTWHGYDDWRLPTQPSETDGELSSILAKCPDSPYIGNACIDNIAFPNTSAWWFWSSSSDALNPTYNAWAVHFGYGRLVRLSAKSFAISVRCVRSEP